MTSDATPRRSLPACGIPPGMVPAADGDPGSRLAKAMASTRSFATAEALLEDAIARRRPDGLILEFGVYTGRTINFIADRVPDATVFGFDSFAGLPEDWRPDFRKGTFATSPPAVRPNVRLVIGLFEETLPPFLAGHAGPVSLMHVDCDLYSSTRTVLTLCRDRIRAGTMIVFDEYWNYPGWQDHEHRAFMEFIAATGWRFDYASLVPGGEQVGVRITG